MGVIMVPPSQGWMITKWQEKYKICGPMPVHLNKCFIKTNYCCYCYSILINNHITVKWKVHIYFININGMSLSQVLMSNSFWFANTKSWLVFDWNKKRNKRWSGEPAFHYRWLRQGFLNLNSLDWINLCCEGWSAAALALTHYGILVATLSVYL